MTTSYILKTLFTFLILSGLLYAGLYALKRLQKSTGLSDKIQILDYKMIKQAQITVIKIHSKTYIVANNQNHIKLLDTLEM